jgi:hypothetical protein
MAIKPVNEMNNVDSVSGFSNPGGRFAITNKSVLYLSPMIRFMPKQ